jgi:hypothetical protein
MSAEVARGRQRTVEQAACQFSAGRTTIAASRASVSQGEPPALDDDLVHSQRYEPDKVPADKEVVGEGWTATRDGELYVYLNKPVLGFWGVETWISKYVIPNAGKASIVIRK